MEVFKIKICGFLLLIFASISSCNDNTSYYNSQNEKFQLIVLAPGHFHASLLQKSMYPDINQNVKVFASSEKEVQSYLDLVNSYNQRTDNPTSWHEEVVLSDDYLEKMLTLENPEKKIVIIAGNNRTKSEFISKAIEKKFNVLVDKPMAINSEGFKLLENSFEISEGSSLLFDIMTERYAIVNILLRMLLHNTSVLGDLVTGSPESPSAVFKSIHYYAKNVSGKPLVRPAWFFDVKQQGEGMVDITTHFVDLVQWICFPDQIFDYKNDIEIVSAKRWPVLLKLEDFLKVTEHREIPEYLRKYVIDDHLEIYSNGLMNYTIRGINAEVGVEWRYEAPEGERDAFYSMVKGERASAYILQNKDQEFEPTLYVEPIDIGSEEWHEDLQNSINEISKVYPGIGVKKEGSRFRVIIPEKHIVEDEKRFSKVVVKYLEYLNFGNLPEWEKSYMLTKYYITIKALEKAHDSNTE